MTSAGDHNVGVPLPLDGDAPLPDVAVQWVSQLVVERVARQMRLHQVTEGAVAQALNITQRHLVKKLKGRTPLTLADVVQFALMFGEDIWPSFASRDEFFPQSHRPLLAWSEVAGVSRVALRRWPDEPAGLDWMAICSGIVDHISDEPAARAALTASAVRYVVARHLVRLGCTGTLLPVEQPVTMLHAQVPTPAALSFIVNGESGETDSEAVVRLLKTAEAVAAAAQSWRVVVAVVSRDVSQLAGGVISGDGFDVGQEASVDGLAIDKMLEASGSRQRIASMQLRTLGVRHSADDVIVAWAVTKSA